MANDLVPQSFWNFPGLLSSSFFDEDSDLFSPNQASGLSLSEDDQNIYVEAAVPGVNPNDIDVTLNKGMLWIKGKSSLEENKKQRQYYRQATSAFSYRVLLPSTADTGVEPEATCENGVVFVTIPKSQAAKPKKVSVKAKSNQTSENVTVNKKEESTTKADEK